MAGEQIFIVEDERIVAEDLKRMLERLGYKVVGLAASGADAIKKLEAAKPQLVLLDIRIEGEMDGVDIAEHIVTQLDVPVIYLTAYADETTLDRAKGTLPAGYILKHFEERGLKTTIELALYRHHMDQMMKNVGEWHSGILENIEVAVMAVDLTDKVVYLNRAAEKRTKFLLDKAFGKALAEILPPDTEYSKSVVNDLNGIRMGTALFLK